MDDLVTEIRARLDEERNLNAEMNAVRAKMDDNEKRKAPLAFKLFQQFMKNNAGKLNEYTPYYYAFLYTEGSADLVVTRLKYDNKYIPGYSENYAVFKPISRANFNVNMAFNTKLEDYESTGVVIDQTQLDELEKFFTIHYRD